MKHWMLHITHCYHSDVFSGIVSIPERHSYDFIYRVIAKLQFVHNEGLYATDDLSGMQVAFLLKELGFSLQDTSSQLSIGPIKELGLYENWHEGVRFFDDERSRANGEKPYFYPDIFFNDYEPERTHEAILEMDKYFKALLYY